MKKALLLGLLLTGSAHASDFATTFTIQGGISAAAFTTLQLDIDLTARFLSANGALTAANGTGSPVSGTCQWTNSNGAFCVLQNGYLTFVVDVGQNLAGTIKMLDADGNAMQIAPIQILEVL